MNKTLAIFARSKMSELLSQCKEGQIEMFKLMYGRDGGKRSIEDAKLLSIDDVVSEVPEERFSLAMDQIERTILKNESR